MVRIERSVLRQEIYVYNRFNERVMTVEVDYWTILDIDKCVRLLLDEYPDELEYLLDMKLEKIKHCFVTKHLI